MVKVIFCLLLLILSMNSYGQSEHNYNTVIFNKESKPIEIYRIKEVVTNKKCLTYYLNYIEIKNKTVDTIYLYDLYELYKTEELSNRFFSTQSYKILVPEFYSDIEEKNEREFDLQTLNDAHVSDDCLGSYSFYNKLRSSIINYKLDYNNVKRYVIAPKELLSINVLYISKNSDTSKNDLKNYSLIYYTKNDFHELILK